MATVDDILTKGVSEVLPKKEGLKNLMGKRKIRVYLGVDPTGTRLHLGHTIPLRKLNEFAQNGDEAILLIGTGTVLAGDPSQRAKVREKITQEKIDENIKTWREQAGKVLDLKKVKIKQNGDWLLTLTYADILNIASNISSVQLFKRDMFQKRIESGDIVWTNETLYPLFQGYDSVALETDVEIGGTDQVFNMLIGRELLKKMKNKEKYILTTPLINGTDGKPMSKSSGNCIWLDDSSVDIYGKIMSTQDSEIEPYWNLLTDLPQDELKSLKPLDAKKKLAFDIVRSLNGAEEANLAQENFEKVFQKGGEPDETRQITVSKDIELVDFLMENTLAPSISQAKRLVEQGAIEIEGEKVNNPKEIVKPNKSIKIGKKTFIKTK